MSEHDQPTATSPRKQGGRRRSLDTGPILRKMALHLSYREIPRIKALLEGSDRTGQAGP